MSKWLLIIGTVLGLVSVFLTNYIINDVRSSQVSQPFLRLNPDIALSKGDKISTELLRTELLPKSLNDLRHITMPDTEDTRAWIEGRSVTQDLPAGAFLLYKYFSDEPGKRFAAGIANNQRAITLPVNSATAVAYFVEPGSRVDILGTFEMQGQAEQVAFTRTILQNVKVLAVERATSRGNYLGMVEQGFSNVTVEVSPENAEKLVFALGQSTGGLTLVLRNNEDQQELALPSANWDTLRN